MNPLLQKTAATQSLGQYLESIRPEIAQAVVEAWEYGTQREGEGMCGYISDEILNTVLNLNRKLRGTLVHSHDHSWVVVADRKEAYKIDIPWTHYEEKEEG